MGRVGSSILHKRKCVSDTGIFVCKLVGIASKAVRLFEGRTIQAEGVVNAKAQKCEHVWFVHKRGSTVVWPQCRDQGENWWEASSERWGACRSGRGL